jgi:hypothetical protein
MACLSSVVEIIDGAFRGLVPEDLAQFERCRKSVRQYVLNMNLWSYSIYDVLTNPLSDRLTNSMSRRLAWIPILAAEEDLALLKYINSMPASHQKKMLRDFLTRGVTLFVYAGADDDLMFALRGKYIMRGSHHDRPYFELVHPKRKTPVVLYFWSRGDSGWWFGVATDSERVYAYGACIDNVSALPLQKQWRTRTGDIDASLVVVLE